MSSGFRHFAGLKGTKQITVGADDSVYNFTTIADAVAAAQNNDVIFLAPEVHTLTAQVVINKPLRIVGMSSGTSAGGARILSDGVMTAALFSIELAAQGASSSVVFENLYIQQVLTGYDCIAVNNTSIAQTLNVKFFNCSVLVKDSGESKYGVNVSHATAGQLINLEFHSGKLDEVSTVNFAAKNAGDKIVFDGMVLRPEANASACITTADNLAAGIVLHKCFVTALKATSGGHATQTVKSYFSYSAAAAVVTGDLIGSQTETIVGS